ncbi:YbjQ family protein [Streptomyces rochei]|uniref:YbjQ family protein n=1 Tax=Streptomyces rochei TaxID=1928 RepID=UPI003631929F
MGIEEYGGGQGPRPEVLVVTTNDLPGYRVQEVLGEVFGLTVRSRHLGSQIGAGLKSLVGGELRGLTKTLVETRNQAMERLVEQARARGANAVLAFRFDVTEAADGAFNPLLELGFASAIRKEYAWRTERGESTRNLDAFTHLTQRPS